MISSMMSKSYLLLSGTRFLVDLGDSLIFALVKLHDRNGIQSSRSRMAETDHMERKGANVGPWDASSIPKR